MYEIMLHGIASSSIYPLYGIIYDHLYVAVKIHNHQAPFTPIALNSPTPPSHGRHMIQMQCPFLWTNDQGTESGSREIGMKADQIWVDQGIFKHKSQINT